MTNLLNTIASYIYKNASAGAGVPSLRTMHEQMVPKSLTKEEDSKKNK